MRRALTVATLLIVTAAGCAKEKSIKIGAVLPLTGAHQLYGQSIQKGVELAFEKLLRQESDYQYSLSVEDSASDPDRGAQLVEQLYSDGFTAIIGGVTTPEALKAVPVADQYDRVLLSPSASTPELTGISKYFYRVFVSDSREGTTMANFATQKLKISNIVILAREDAFAQGNREVFDTNFVRQGGEVLEMILFPSEGGDFSGLIDRVLTLSPDAVYIAAYAEETSEMILELRRQRFGGYVLATAAFASPEIIEKVGQPAEGVFLTQAGFDTKSEEPLIKDFVDSYRAKYGLTPDLYAAHGYDAVMVLAEAVKESGGEFASDLWSALRGLRDFQGVTGTLQFDERGDVQKFPRVFVVNEGE
ncbi:MAG: penicillin-binding protein activator, partial [Acidobacteriota bacterium]|nr:penicillin-binding protein activator [Acidobacteriota bacterium]